MVTAGEYWGENPTRNLPIGRISLPAVALAPPQNCALHKRTVIRMPFAEMLSPGEGLVGVSGRMSCLWW